MTRIKIWKDQEPFELGEKRWEEQAQKAAAKQPIKGLKSLPNMPGMTPKTKKNIKWKAFRWIVTKDHGFKVFKQVLRQPIRYIARYFRSLLKRKKIKREEDFFLYGIESSDEFKELLVEEDTLLVVGFSYCHKPFECPSKRFTPDCIHDLSHSACQQCFIGKMIHALPEDRVIPLIIPTVHYIGASILEIVNDHPDKQVLFLITACEMTLEMFANWGDMAGIRGIGVRLDGRICNTMDAFALSEHGVKPGLTVVLDKTKRKMLDLIQVRRERTPRQN